MVTHNVLPNAYTCKVCLESADEMRAGSLVLGARTPLHQLANQSLRKSDLDPVASLVQNIESRISHVPARRLVEWDTAIFLAISSRHCIWALPRNREQIRSPPASDRSSTSTMSR